MSGLSGAGKSQAIRALEDLGYYSVDNLPVPLLGTLAHLVTAPGSEIDQAAVVVDVRMGSLLSAFPAAFRRLKRLRGLRPVLIFLEASDQVLIRRFSETRRPHPLAGEGSVVEGIRRERQRLRPIRRLADEVIDTSDMTVHELRQAFLVASRGSLAAEGPVVTVQSFGFKHGVPLDSDLVFDVRFLPNPHFVPALRPKTGRDREVVSYLERVPETGEFIERVASLLQFLVPRFAREGKSYVTVSVGCTGGQHRSVALAAAIARALRKTGMRLRVRHRDIGRE